jgi:hypothetical protein
MPEYDDISAIASGFDAVGSLALISSLSVGGVFFLPPLTVGAYSRGERRFKANGVPYVSGAKTKTLQSFMTLAQYTYIRDTFTGEVTMHTWLENTTAYDYNAVLWFEEVGVYEPINVASDDLGWAALAIKWNLTNIEIIP